MLRLFDCERPWERPNGHGKRGEEISIPIGDDCIVVT